jgi:hypothetical protein
MRKARFRAVTASIALTVVPLAGCDTATEELSAADACGDLIELSLSEMRQVQENIGDPQLVATTYRDIAKTFKEKAAQIDDADVRRAADQYAAKMRELADQATSGQAPDFDALVRANRRLAEACG